MKNILPAHDAIVFGIDSPDASVAHTYGFHQGRVGDITVSSLPLRIVRFVLGAGHQVDLGGVEVLVDELDGARVDAPVTKVHRNIGVTPALSQHSVALRKNPISCMHSKSTSHGTMSHTLKHYFVKDTFMIFNKFEWIFPLQAGDEPWTIIHKHQCRV